MKLFKSITIFTILVLLTLGYGCQKEPNYTSRDTSGLKPPPPPPIDSSLVTFDNCDKIDGWETVGTPVASTSGPKEGEAFISGKITSGNDFIQFIKTRVPPLDTKLTLDNGQLIFWLFIQDPTKLKADGQIQVSSSGQPDNKRVGWPLASIIPTLKSGWNQLALNFSDGDISGDGPPDFSAINYFKIFFWTTDKVTADFAAGLDNIQFRKKSTSSQSSEAVIIDNCDAIGTDASAWQTIGTPQLVTSGQKEGSGYIQGTRDGGDNFFQFIKTLPADVDTKTTIAGGQLQLWLNIPDPAALKLDGQIQFSSSKDPDKNRVGWALANIIPSLKPGWNQLKLNLSDGELTGDGGPDLTAMNYFKIFFWLNDKPASPVNFGIDDIKIIQIPPPDPIMIDNCDALGSDDFQWQTIGTPLLITTGQKEGTGFIQGTRDGGDNFFQFIKTLPANIDTKLKLNTGQLQFWLNIPDPGALKLDGQIQFSSSKDPDKNRIGWAFANVIPTLKPGWNFVKLDFSTDGMTGDGGPDLSAMNYFKMFFWLNDKPAAPVNFGIDGIQVQRRP